jgi:hypothetical protein
MATQTASPAKALDLLRMTEGLIVHHTLCAAAKLGIADLLKDGALCTGQLAAELQVYEEALYRTLRFLAGQGVFHETAARKFRNNELSEWLRSDVPGSVRSMLIYRGTPYFFSSLGNLLYSIETGAPAQEKASGMNGFEYLRNDPEQGQIFDDAMTGTSMLWGPIIAAAYDFGRWGSLMDLGGGNGLLLATIMRQYPALRGVLADQAQVLERARQRAFWSPDVAERVQFEPTDFFEAVPSGCRACLMRNIIHDWDDERARRILLNCRRAVPDDGVLLLVEYCIGGENIATMGKAVDIIMLAITGGKERTLSEHRELLASAGFRLNQTIPLSNGCIILEAKPASD